MNRYRTFLPLVLGLAATLPALVFIRAEQKAPAKPAPLKALLIAGGCCHDYAKQHIALYKGIQQRANVRVDVIWTRDGSTNPPLPLYDNPDWAKGYDVIIHDECAAGNKDNKVIKNILDAHQTIPAVHLHCAMHSFRNGTDQWFKHLGLQSNSHGPQEPIAIQFTDKQHPITEPLEDWTTGKEELYNNVNLFDAQPLALGVQRFKRGDKEAEATAVVAWTNEKQGAPSFSTTIGHNTFTVEDPRYLDLVTRGLLWTCGKLNAEYLTPYTGSNLVEEIKVKEEKPATVFGDPPADATFVKLTAHSVQSDAKHYPWCAIDGNPETRWCGANNDKPGWLQLEFEKPTTVTGAEILWEQRSQWYQYKIETSTDGKQWDMARDALNNTTGGDTKDTLNAKDIRFLRVTITAQEKDMWPSLWELKLTGPTIKKLYPRLDKKEAAQLKRVSGAGYEHSGNIPPRIVALSPAEEAEILKDAKVPEGFDLTLFAPWQTANYPVYVAASPGGDLYVSSDGNGSLGRQPNRGRVLRLRDTDKDGRADEVTEFVRDIDSPRGLVWDHDRLYLLHPPHITVFFDRDGDGIAEESKCLVSDIAFGFKDRPADHTTNGLELGIDGWIYIAGGDFGFLKATGSDGRTLQHRGGGVIRFRTDGSGLELFATGTRNILGTPMSPTLDMFARDNTNDGGGWDVRFHHFTGLEDHGYPRMYINFGEEIVQPLADYGGGSGCGSVYIHEPGFPAEWNQAPFTCDWGRSGSFRHSVAPYGATFRETEAPRHFIKMTRPTDADVDGMSAVYQASWRGPATFGWAGPDQGYVVRVTPSGYTPTPLPDFDALSDSELLAALDSPSHIRTLAAQRALLRRGPGAERINALADDLRDPNRPLRSRIAAVFAISQWNTPYGTHALAMASTPGTVDLAILPFVMRALGDVTLNARETGAVFARHLRADHPRTKVEATIAAARQGLVGVAPAIAALLGDPDPVVVHTAFQALAKLGAHEAALGQIDSARAETRNAAAWALMRMHKPELVDAILARLDTESTLPMRQPLIATLCRLYHREAEWKGDSWGTRPDTRGPYYQLATWEQSERILAALKELLAKATAEEAAFIVSELGRNRIESNDTLDGVLKLAASDDKLIPTAIAQLAAAKSVPGTAIPIIAKGARNAATPPSALAAAVALLLKTDDKDALPASLAALVHLDKVDGHGKEKSAARNAFLNAPKLENHHLALEQIAAEHAATAEGCWATMGILQLASRKNGSPESREMSRAAIDKAWFKPEQRLALIRAAADLRNPLLNDRIATATSDPVSAIAVAANDAVARLKIQLPGEDKTPKVATLKPADALAQVIRHSGDIALGEAVFARATCTACHTVTQSEPQKGPYLGNIAETYRRPDLAQSILEPNKTIAQGFATNFFTLTNGKTQLGFVTSESGDTVTVRDITATEHTLNKSTIQKRETLPTSLMPPGLMGGFSVHEMASLLDYLESLAKKK